jgi:hypothetical protein
VVAALALGHVEDVSISDLVLVHVVVAADLADDGRRGSTGDGLERGALSEGSGGGGEG